MRSKRLAELLKFSFDHVFQNENLICLQCPHLNLTASNQRGAVVVRPDRMVAWLSFSVRIYELFWKKISSTA